MFNVALTGGIASGKTTVSDMFAELGANIIDTDTISRELVKPGQAALQSITALFGQHVLHNNGELDRTQLREIIFADPSARKKLEALLHPLISQQVWQQAKNTTADYNVLVIPLLYENRSDYAVDRILTVDVPVEIQKIRLQQRDLLSDTQIEQVLASQSSREQRLSIADDVIENISSPEDLYAHVEQRHKHYLQLSV